MPILIIAGIIGIVAYAYFSSTASASENVNANDSGSTDLGQQGLPMNFPNTVGFRNNNPGNLRYISFFPWQGQIGEDSGGYGVYDTLSNGVRAMGKQLDKYVDAGTTTIGLIITKWAPGNENDTASYIRDVTRRMGVGTNDDLAWPGEQPALVDAIIIHENGSNPIAQSDLISYLNS